MNSITKTRLAKTCEYHEGVSKYYKSLAGLGEEDPIPEEEKEENGSSLEGRVTVDSEEPVNTGTPSAPLYPQRSGSQQTGLSDEEKKAKQRKDDLTLARTHAEVARQLRAVLARQPTEPAILVAQREQTVLRDPAFDLKPVAGRMH